MKALGKVSFQQHAVSLIVPATQTSNSTVAQFVTEMKTANSSQPADETALTCWLALNPFAQVAGKLSVVNAWTVLAAMNTLKPAVVLGVIPPYGVAGIKSPVASAPRLFNPDVMYVKVKDGVQIPLTGKFVSPFG